MNRKLILVIVSMVMALPVLNAQSLWTSAEVSKKIAGGLSGFGVVEYRTHAGMSSTERWAGTLGVDYKFCNYLKATVAYVYIHSHAEAKGGDSGYWLPKHRGYFALTGSYSWNNFSLSLRERYQDTYSTEKVLATKTLQAKHKHTLRSRLEAKYSINKINLTPYVSCELHNFVADGMKLEETRWTAGLSYKIDRKNSVELYYRFIDEVEKIDNHVIGVGYKLKL